MCQIAFSLKAMKRPLLKAVALVAMLGGACLAPASGAPVANYEEVPFGYLSTLSVNAVLKNTLSARGRYVILPGTGRVRIFDSGDRVQAARSALEALQQAPANIAIELEVTTGMRQVTRQDPAADEQGLGYEFPVPQNFDPPRITNSYSGGSIVIVPAQPRNFTTRRVGAGGIVNISPTGYRTLEPEVRRSETALEGGVIHRVSGSAVLGKPAILPVLARVRDVQGLREWALTRGAIQHAEPPWQAAGTELLVTPEITNGNLSLNVVPQISIYGRAQHLSLPGCATVIPVERGTRATIDQLQGTDPEFYRVFFDAREAADGTMTSISVAAQVHYLSQ